MPCIADAGTRGAVGVRPIAKLQQAVRGAVGKAFLVRGGKVATSEELRRGEVVLERVVDGEHEVVWAQNCSGTVEHRHVEHPAAGDVDILVVDGIAHCGGSWTVLQLASRPLSALG